MIPPILIRTVPAETTPEVEQWWDHARALHPSWTATTYRDPINPYTFPITSDLWPRCQNGAQLAGLVRLEALWWHGGIYLDSDVELYRPLDSLLGVQAFAGYEDPGVIPDAVIGAEPRHPAIAACIDHARRVISGQSGEWRDAWASGPGATTAVFPGRPDVLLLPPGSFYPYHYTNKGPARSRDHHAEQPWAFGAHHWEASWLG